MSSPPSSPSSPSSTSTWRHILTFALVYLSYVFCYFARKNYAFFLNDLIHSNTMAPTQAAAFGSTMELAYGAGKLVAGPVADNTPPVLLLALTMLVSAGANALMFQSGYYALDVALWGLNGFAQAFTWPALALVFFHWFGTSPMRGTLYSILSTNQNLGSALTPVLLTPLVKIYGWKFALWGPAIACGSFALVLALFLRDHPPSAVLDTSRLLSPKPPNTAAASASHAARKTPATTSSTPAEPASAPPKSDFTTTVKRMLASREVWFLGLGYALLTFVRVGLSDWSLVFLKQNHLVTPEASRDCLVFYELGGFVGGLAAGAVSDYVFAGRRGPVMVLFAGLITCPTVWALFFSPGMYPDALKDVYLFAHLGQDREKTLRGFYFIIGFGSFGPHVLVGLIARELFPAAPSTAGSFAKSLAQVGGSMAGVPVSILSQRFGWPLVGFLWSVCAGLSAICFIPLTNTASSPSSNKPKKE